MSFVDVNAEIMEKFRKGKLENRKTIYESTYLHLLYTNSKFCYLGKRALNEDSFLKILVFAQKQFLNAKHFWYEIRDIDTVPDE